MATRLTFLCASATASSRVGGFPAPDEPLDDGGARKAAAFRLRGARPDLVLSSPSKAARETADAIGIDATIEPCLADLGFGRWTGRTIAEIADREPSPLRRWFADPTAAPPGGESMRELVSRVGAWVDRHADDDRRLLVISHAAVMRAAIAHCLSAPIAAIMRIDVAPLTALALSFHGEWRLQELRRADEPVDQPIRG